MDDTKKTNVPDDLLTVNGRGPLPPTGYRSEHDDDLPDHQANDDDEDIEEMLDRDRVNEAEDHAEVASDDEPAAPSPQQKRSGKKRGRMARAHEATSSMATEKVTDTAGLRRALPQLLKMEAQASGAVAVVAFKLCGRDAVGRIPREKFAREHNVRPSTVSSWITAGGVANKFFSEDFQRTIQVLTGSRNSRRLEIDKLPTLPSCWQLIELGHLDRALRGRDEDEREKIIAPVVKKLPKMKLAELRQKVIAAKPEHQHSDRQVADVDRRVASMDGLLLLLIHELKPSGLSPDRRERIQRAAEAILLTVTAGGPEHEPLDTPAATARDADVANAEFAAQ